LRLAATRAGQWWHGQQASKTTFSSAIFVDYDAAQVLGGFRLISEYQ
jgi:hypothetical protein